MREGERDRERVRERERERERDGDRERLRVRETGRERKRQGEREREGESEREKNYERERERESSSAFGGHFNRRRPWFVARISLTPLTKKKEKRRWWDILNRSEILKTGRLKKTESDLYEKTYQIHR